MLAIIAVVLIFWALKATRVVSLPLVFGGVLLLLFRPLQERMDKRLPRWVSVVTILLLTLAFLAFLGWLIYYSATQVAPELPRYVEQVRTKVQSLEETLRQQGFNITITSDSAGAQSAQSAPAPSPASEGAASRAINLLNNFLDGLSLTVLTLTVLIFLLIEANGFYSKLDKELASATSRHILDAFSRTSGKFARYIVVQSFTSVLTGVFTYLYCLLLGVEFALVWGTIGFVLNFLPTVGSILAVLPPTLFALSFSGLGQAALLFVGLSAIQLILGNFVDPALQGKAVKLSPVVVLLSVVFWGWLWGIGGAIIGVPITIALVLLFQEFDATRPVAVLLAEPGSIDSSGDSN